MIDSEQTPKPMSAIFSDEQLKGLLNNNAKFYSDRAILKRVTNKQKRGNFPMFKGLTLICSQIKKEKSQKRSLIQQ